ncbi:DUF1450 domain-containing protein [Halomarina halobia]|uniref:DUF1450 domain-containing protein n=1 Tax=Halomarina halobia TaxID=3033386 RepID=A0ABD6ACL8_9EURY|nr:DUF1450 domain-containing protein [Halomarina sp. PSR21]
MPPIVEYCLSGHHADLDALRGECEVELRERRCLEHCGICRTGPFAVVDGDLVTGADLSSAIRTLADGTWGERE